MKLLVVCYIFPLAISPAFTEELRQSTVVSVAISTEAKKSVDFRAPNSTGTLRTPLVQVSEGMMKKIRELEKEVAEEKGQDDAALERIGAKISATIVLMPFNGELLAAANDTTIDWRIRYLLLYYKSYTAGEAKSDKYADELIAIMQNEADGPKVRGMAALMLADVAAKDAKVRKALQETAENPNTPGELLQSVMTAVGVGGLDDADALMKLTERPPTEFNDVGINLNAVRALGQSKDPRAAGYLIKIFDESAPDSFFNVTALEQLDGLTADPQKWAELKPLLIPRLLKLLDTRSYLGPSRREAAETLAKHNVKEAVEPILKWFLPANGTHAREGGGGNTMDVMCGARNLAKLGDKRAIPVLERFIDNFAADSRWSWVKEDMEHEGRKYPDDHMDYKYLKKQLDILKRQK